MVCPLLDPVLNVSIQYNDGCVYLIMGFINSFFLYSTYGQSRSATIVLAYVMRAMNMTCDDAMTIVMKQKPDIRLGTAGLDLVIFLG